MGEGEFELIARLVKRLPAAKQGLRIASGDDAAVIEPSGRAAATTIDATVEGVAEVAAREGVTVAGGDVSRAPALMLTVACVGYEGEGAPLLGRGGASAGDLVVVTGELGGAA